MRIKDPEEVVQENGRDIVTIVLDDDDEKVDEVPQIVIDDEKEGETEEEIQKRIRREVDEAVNCESDVDL